MNHYLYHDTFPTYAAGWTIDALLLRLYRSLNLRASLPAQALVDALKSAHFHFLLLSYKLKINFIDITFYEENLYEPFKFTFDMYRVLSNEIEREFLTRENLFGCPACPSVQFCYVHNLKI